MFAKLRDGAWLDRDLIWRVAVINALIMAMMMAALFLTAHHTVDRFGRPLGTDFSVFWNAGDLANTGHVASAWDPNALNGAAHRLHGGGVGDSAWLYPPIFLLVVSPLARLPYVAALLLWQLVSLALIGAALALILDDRRAWFVAVASPLSWLVLAHGQNAFLTAALLGAGMTLLDRRPFAAGSVFGLLAYKPQLGVILGPLLILTRNGRALMMAVVTASILCLLSYVIWGSAPWAAFAASLRLSRGFMEIGAVGFYKSASLFAMARQWGAGIRLSYGVQALGVVAGLLIVWRLRNTDTRVRAAGAGAAAALSTPYLLDYDMATVGIGATFLYAAAAKTKFLPYERWALAFLWFAPWIARPAAQFLTIPLGPLAIILLAALALRRAELTALPSRHSHEVSGQ